MRKRDALKLHNGDQCQVRIDPGEWVEAQVLSATKCPDGRGGTRVLVEVTGKQCGYVVMDHTDIR
jgi:hypothetical protein